MLLLFDIDGTLLLKGAEAHAAAVVAALCEVWEVEPPQTAHGVEAAGRTDQAIARDILELAGISAEQFDQRRDDFILAAASHYELLVPDDLSDRLAPHAAETLAEVDAHRSAAAAVQVEGTAGLTAAPDTAALERRAAVSWHSAAGR